MRSAAIRFGSRNTLGAASIPATAPSAAASPQPKESIQVTRTPTSRASAGFTAAARIARPSFVYWNSAQRSATIASTTAIVPMSAVVIATPAISVVPAGNGLSTARTSPPQIQVTRPLIMIRRPIVTITTRSTEPFSFGRITVWCTAAPPRNETPSVNTNAGQYPQPWLVDKVQAM